MKISIAPFKGLLFVSLILALITGCATKARKPGGEMDTPEAHYQQGMKYWNLDQYVKAEEEFRLAVSLDSKFAPGISGLALTTAQKAKTAGDKEKEEQGFKEALKLADKAQNITNKIPEVFIAKALVLTMQYEGKEPAEKWLDKVEKQYEKAIDVAPDNSEAYFRRGYSYKKAFVFKKAADDFRKVLDLGKKFTREADEQWELVQKIERAAPGTEVGKRIALVEKISRADIAALFVTEMNIDQLIKKKRPVAESTEFKPPEDPQEMEVEKTVSMAKVTDLEGHWAKNFIMDIVDVGIRGLEPYPDHTFHPNDLISRGEYAMMVEDIIIMILGDESLATRYVGTTRSRFPDVSYTHPYYNAICTAVDKDIMDSYINGSFGPNGSVSGPDALLVIRKLIEFNKIE